MKPHCQSGISLVELLIVCAIANLLLLGVISFFYMMKKEYQQVYHTEKIISHQLLTSHLLQELFNQEGYFGCQSSSIDSPIIFDDVDSQRPHWLQKKMLKYSHAILFRYQQIKPLKLMLPLTKGSEVVSLTQKANIKKNQSIVFSDCFFQEVHQVLSIENSGKRLILDSAINHHFTKLLQISPLKEKILYVTKNTNGQKALMIRENKRSETLITGIKNFEWIKSSAKGVWFLLTYDNKSSEIKYPIYLTRNLYA